MTLRILITVGMLFSVATFLAGQEPATISPAELRATNAYARQVEQFIKLNLNKRRTFGNVGDEQDNWREFKGKVAKGQPDPADLDEAANIWTRKGKVVASAFTFQSQSGDWAQYVTYYFREDGTLAKIHARLNTFYGNTSVIRDKYYSPTGTLLKTTTSYLDLKTQKPKKGASFQDEPIPDYLTVQSLPFSKLL